jgi:glycosyltransferase involved in cell wall biosynthesis
MKYSFLIPSRNRLELLKHAVESIRRQGIQGCEIVIADNASEQDYGAYVKSLADSRIVYSRSAEPLPVTDNWSRALALASGDYVLMLGDDDALTPWFYRQVRGLVEQSADKPDIVYLAGFHYCYPQVMPGLPKGYLADVRNSRFLAGRSAPFRLPREEAVAVANAAFGFRYLFGFNSQHFLFNAEFLRQINSLGGIFQSPYPDTFAAVVSFLRAGSIMVLPEPAVIIGISPKSFGYFYFNDRTAEGYQFLANENVSPDVRAALEGVILPGDRNNTNWLVAVEVARRALGPTNTPEIDVARYRILQSVAFLRDIYLKGARRPQEADEFAQQLDPRERAMFAGLRAAVGAAAADGRKNVNRAFQAIDRELGQFWPAQVRMMGIRRHSNIADAYDWLEAKKAYANLPTASHGLRRVLGL